MSARKEAVFGWVRPVRSTEDTVLYEYRTPRRLLRGLAYVTLAVTLVGFGVKIGVHYASLIVWLIAILPLVLSGVFVSWGLLDLITRGLFELEVDRRARTLALAMPMALGEQLAKVGFADVTSVSLIELRPLPGTRGPIIWSVLLSMRGGKKIGLGVLDRSTEAERLATHFGELIGVAVTRSVHESRE